MMYGTPSASTESAQTSATAVCCVTTVRWWITHVIVDRSCMERTDRREMYDPCEMDHNDSDALPGHGD